MSNSNENDIKEKTLFEDISDFGDFRNQFQQAIDFVVQKQSTNIDIDNFLKTSGSTFEDNGWQFKINNAQPVQSNANTNSAPNLLSENRDNVNQNMLNEITFGLNKQKQNKAACTKLFFDNLEAFELKIDSAEILWLLERLKSKEDRQEIDRYKNRLSEIFGRYIKKLIHRSGILQLGESEQKLFTDSLQALASCVVKIISNNKMDSFDYPGNFEKFETNFRQLEETATQRILSINSADRTKSKSEVVNDVFALLIDEIIILNKVRDGMTSSRGAFFSYLMQDTKINSKNLPIEDKLEIIKFLSKESFRDNVPKAEFDYLDYHNWDLERYTDIDFMFKLTIDRFDYHNLNVPVNFDDINEWGGCDEDGRATKPINYYQILIFEVRSGKNNSSSFIKRVVFKLVTELGVPDVIDVIKNCHLSLITLLLTHYELENIDELLNHSKNILIALLGCYKAKSKINSIIADIWEENFKARINYFLDKKYNLCQLMNELSYEIQKGIAKDTEELFTEVKKVFSSEVQPKTAFEAFKILCEKNENDKLKELIGDDNIFNLFLEYVEQNVKNNRSNEHADLAQFNSLITEIKNQHNSGELSIDDKFEIAKIFLNKDFDYINNLAKITNKLKKLILKDDISGDNISSKENKEDSAKKDIDSTKNDLKINEQTKNVVQNKDNKDNSFVINNGIKNELSTDLPNIEKEKEEKNVTTQPKQENQKSDQEKKENYVETSNDNGSSINDKNENNNSNRQKDTILLERKEGNEEKGSDNAKNSSRIDEGTKNVVQNKDNKDNGFVINNGTENKLISDLPNTKKEKEKTDITTQQNQEFKLELTLSNNNTITLFHNSCKTAMAELRECSDFCYQVCLIKEAIERQNCHQAFECWKQLWNELPWGKRIKVTFYNWFIFRIAKWWDSSITIKIKSTILTQSKSNTNFLKLNQNNNRFLTLESKEKTFHDIDQSLDK